MPAKTPAKGRNVDASGDTTPAPEQPAQAKETKASPKSKAGPGKKAATGDPAPATQKGKSRGDRRRKYGLAMLESEHDALISLKNELTEATGAKVRKGDLLRLAVKLLLSQSPAKVRAGIAKLANANADA